MKTLVSCIVPVFNGERYLTEALNSIFDQDHQPLEVIVVDDGSTDGTADVVSQYKNKVTYLHQENAGPSVARNTGIKASNGKFIGFLDADDLWVQGKLKRQMACFDAEPELGICTSHNQNFWMPELADEETKMRAEGAGDPQPGTFPSMLVRRSVFDDVGMLNPTLKHRDAMEWLSRAKDAGVPTKTLPEVFVRRRLHLTNISREEEAADPDEVLRALKARLDRQRGKSPG